MRKNKDLKKICEKHKKELKKLDKKISEENDEPRFYALFKEGFELDLLHNIDKKTKREQIHISTNDRLAKYIEQIDANRIIKFLQKTLEL